VRRSEPRLALGLFCLVCFCLPVSNEFCMTARAADPKSEGGEKRTVRHDPASDARLSAAAFKSIVPVLRSPRCLNCHSSGDFPRQGDDSRPHSMQVRRGPDGHGTSTVKCSTCHQDRNLAGQHMPPGAPDWHLPSPTEPMVWEGLTDRQLCQLILDPQRNGKRSAEAIVEHLQTPLVQWGFAPGEGRAAVPMSSERFLARIKVWISKGAACPP
jgi:hypothetical protein